MYIQKPYQKQALTTHPPKLAYNMVGLPMKYNMIHKNCWWEQWIRSAML